MKSSIAIVLLIVGISHGQVPTTAPAPISGKLGESIELFNGKDMTGWVFTAGPSRPPTTAPAPTISDVYQVANGIMHYRGRSNGYVRTEKQFGGNYVLLVEMRHLIPGDGGVLIGITGPDKIWPRCIEVQGQFGDVADLWNLGNFKMTTDPARTAARRFKKIGPLNERPRGQWNALEIISDHGNLTVKLNGQVQNVAANVEDLSGAIGLQSQDAIMEFRKIEWTPIENP
jgi:Domain of Unknown Function (DUF1080)